MTNVIQNVLAARLNQVDASIEKLEGGQEANTERIAQLEQKCTELLQSVTSLQQDHDELVEKHSRAEAEFRAQLHDQENRQRRKSLRIEGFPEGIEGNDAVAFLEKWLPPILGLSNTPEIERAHRMVQRRPQESGSPQAFVIKLLRWKDTVQILSAARKKRDLMHGNSKIKIFPDLSPTLHKKRMAFSALKSRLRQGNVKYEMFLPAALKVDTRSGRHEHLTRWVQQRDFFAEDNRTCFNKIQILDYEQTVE